MIGRLMRKISVGIRRRFILARFWLIIIIFVTVCNYLHKGLFFVTIWESLISKFMSTQTWQLRIRNSVFYSTNSFNLLNNCKGILIIILASWEGKSNISHWLFGSDSCWEILRKAEKSCWSGRERLIFLNV